MKTHGNSFREHGTFYYKNKKVIGYGLINGGGGKTTVFSFFNKTDAKTFVKHFLSGVSFQVHLNDCQVICFAGYDDSNDRAYDHNDIETLTYTKGDM
jgi:hypothetical protein